MWSFTCIYWLSHEDKSISSCHEDGTTHEKKYATTTHANIFTVCVFDATYYGVSENIFFPTCVNGYENFCLHLRLLWLETTALSVQSKGNNLQCLKNIKMRRQFFSTFALVIVANARRGCCCCCCGCRKFLLIIKKSACKYI